MNDTPPPQPGPDSGPEQPPTSPPSSLLPYIIAALVFSMLYMLFIQAPERERRYESPYTLFKSLVKDERERLYPILAPRL